MGKFQISWGPSVLVGPNFFFGREGARPFSSIKPPITNHVNSRIVDGKIMFHVCMLSFLTFTGEFSILEFSVISSAHSNSEKSVYYFLVITL